ncbi:hypothetical protein [Aeoliella sp.]|uniref:hypothetical protein n=1 Tax=Aeoliella sp. TaxID=2795800 RepID=UPI003CCBB4AA
MSRSKSISALATQLQIDGIVTVPEYLCGDRCDSIVGQLADFLRNADLSRSGCTPKYKVFTEGEAAYDAAVEHELPIINVRGYKREDAGMIDVFNVDRIAPLCRELREPRNVLRVVRRLHPTICCTNLNAYINHEVVSTREYHRDTVRKLKYKFFIYLTDVLSLDDGPYSYLRGTHTGASGDHHQHVLGKRGTLIISNQAGLHRGMPQSAGHERYVLVGNLVLR